MPVYNGEKYLATALESLVAQTYPCLTFFVSDNASTDKTPTIIQEYADKDPRIVCHRMPVNIGALANFRFCLRETQSEFFMWAAHDDIWPDGFVSEAVRCLARDHDAVMVNSTTQLIDENGEKVPDWTSRPQLIDLGGLSYPSRIRALADRVGWCIYGLLRRSAITATSVFNDNSPTHDVLLTYELAAKGSFRVLTALAPFQYRLVPKTPETVARNLGINSATSDKVMTNLFRLCVGAIEASGKNKSEITRAKNIFIHTCANHAEWWNNIRDENNWSQSMWIKLRRFSKLKSLLS